jgi:hypothetical protein
MFENIRGILNKPRKHLSKVCKIQQIIEVLDFFPYFKIHDSTNGKTYANKSI